MSYVTGVRSDDNKPLNSFAQGIDGAALETLFLQSVRALNEYNEWGYQIYYWRTAAGVEVDFILHGPRGFFAFEIKRSTRVNRNDTKGLRAFLQDYPEAQLYLVHGGEQKYYFDAVEAWPMQAMLLALPTLLGEAKNN